MVRLVGGPTDVQLNNSNMHLPGKFVASPADGSVATLAS